MKKFKIIVITLVSTLSLNVFAECYNYYESYQRKLKEAQNTSKSVAVVTGVASFFFGPIATLIVSGLGAGTLATLQSEADRELIKYNKCLAKVEADKRMVQVENQKRYLQAEIERKKREEFLKKEEQEELEKIKFLLDEDYL